MYVPYNFDFKHQQREALIAKIKEIIDNVLVHDYDVIYPFVTISEDDDHAQTEVFCVNREMVYMKYFNRQFNALSQSLLSQIYEMLIRHQYVRSR